MKTIETLSKIPLFESLSEEDKVHLAGLWKPKERAAGTILFRKGDHGNSMYVIEEGIVEISIPGEHGNPPIRVSVFHTGDFFGELSIMDGLPRTAAAAAIEDCRLLEMTREDFMKFLLERPAVAISMITEIGKRLRATNELVTSIASRNVNLELEEQLSFGDRMADRIAEFGGSWFFIIMFAVFLFGWMGINSIQFLFKPFDEFPFIFLNLMLSTLAAIQAPIIMMSQNRAQKKDRIRAEMDYQVNLKSEMMLQQLHAKIDEIRAEELHLLQDMLHAELARSHSKRETRTPAKRLPKKKRS